MINTNNYRGTELLVASGHSICSEAYSHLKFSDSSAAIGVKKNAASGKIRPVDITNGPHWTTMQRKKKKKNPAM